MSGLDRLGEWDDSRYIFRLGKKHGRWTLTRTDKTPRLDKDWDARWYFCKEHASWEEPYRRVTGMEAYTWANKQKRAKERREARKQVSA